MINQVNGFDSSLIEIQTTNDNRMEKHIIMHMVNNVLIINTNLTIIRTMIPLITVV